MMKVILPTVTWFGLAVGVCAALALGVVLVWVYNRGRKS